MKTFLVEYSAGFGTNTHNHNGFGPTIYVEEKVRYETEKDYFDFAEFFLKYSKSDDTYFTIKLLEDRELTKEEKLSQEKYFLLRDATTAWAKKHHKEIDELEDLIH